MINSTYTNSKYKRDFNHVYEIQIARRAYGIVETIVNRGSLPRRG